jgi:copper homeostasis protein
LLTDAEVFGGGALGLVTGALDERGEVEKRVLEAVKRLAPESEITFHRAIDHSADPLRVVESCVELGIDRILTSGGAGLAVDGIPTLIRIIERAGDRIEIAVAGGVGPENVVRIVGETGAREIHFAAQMPAPGKAKGPALSSAGGNARFEVIPDRAKIEGVMNALVKAGLR